MKDPEPQEGSCSAPAGGPECLEESSVPASTAASVELSTLSHARSGLLDGLRSKTDGRKVTSSEPAGDEDEDGSSRSCEAGQAGPPAAAAESADDTPKWSWRGFAAFCGPGLLMSVAYLDPGNLEADIQAGAQTGFALLWWFALVSLGCGTAFQCLSGRVGLVTGKDIAQHCGEQWPRPARWLLWLLLEFSIVAVDIQETVGCAQGLAMLSQGQVPLWAGCIIVSCSAFLLLLLERRGARWLEGLFGTIIGIEAVAMAVNFFRAGVPAKEVALGLFRPTLPSNAIIPAVGALGALVMPYNLYFASAIVQSRRPSPPTPGRIRGVLRFLRLETPLVLLGAFFINLCVICVFAQGFYGTDEEIGLQAAGDLLAERFGEQFKVFWAIGLLAAGQVSTIALTYAGQLVMTGLLQLEVKGWARMLCTRLVALVPALTVALVSQKDNKFDSLNQMLNVVQSIQLPFALIPAIHIAAHRGIMGPPGAFATRTLLSVFCSFVALAVVTINAYFLVLFRQDYLPAGAGASVGWGFLMAAYYACIAYYAVGPDRWTAWLGPRLGPRLGAARASVARSGTAAAAAAGSLAARGINRLKGINWRDPESMLEVHF
ncbi:hypothetical protein ABPG77_005053 [Micractinium sp. CCAP 211/92]